MPPSAAGIEENWRAFLRLGDLFGSLAEETAEHLGYSYPKDPEKGVKEYTTRKVDVLLHVFSTLHLRKPGSI